jgi:hypothetical protein
MKQGGNIIFKNRARVDLYFITRHLFE